MTTRPVRCPYGLLLYDNRLHMHVRIQSLQLRLTHNRLLLYLLIRRTVWSSYRPDTTHSEMLQLHAVALLWTKSAAVSVA